MLENKLSSLDQSFSVRQININAYEYVLEMIEEHFKLTEEPAKSKRKGGGGRPKGSRNKPKDEAPPERLHDEV